ncbi:MAG: HypC/HybG/HupF family hydrogenase formation chaperone [Actinomycetota bacterium]
MCLAIPGKVQSTRDDRGTRMATVEFGGVRKEICLAYLPEVAVDEYVIVHVGFAISKVDEASALETLQMFRDLGIDINEELSGSPTPSGSAVAS